MLDRTRPKQSRSRARREAMIALGQDLLNARDLDDISVVDLTQTLGVSTGSFYTYFEDKTSFFVAVQRAVAQDLDAKIASAFETPEFRKMSPDQRLDRCVTFILTYFRAHTGVLRGALRHEHRIPEAWEPHRMSAQRTVDAMVNDLAPEPAKRLRVATQMAFGAMVNAVLHDPGPLHLHDPEFGPDIIAALQPYLRTAATNAAKITTL